VRRTLIVNADDFGLSEGVNRGVIEAHRDGIVTSASLMVRQPAARAAVDAASHFPRLSLGLHLDVGDWEFANGEWVANYERVPLSDVAALEAEIHAQLELFRGLTGDLPTHLDSHQHAHRYEPLCSLLRGQGDALGIPVRFHSGINYLGDFYGQDEKGCSCAENITPDFLAVLIAELPAGVTELCCHPAAAVDFPGVYSSERVKELAALTDPTVRKAVDLCGVELRGF
jgi:predicted glycoside hydrolase/deacetylase ChbG (UPF0249 family)